MKHYNFFKLLVISCLGFLSNKGSTQDFYVFTTPAPHSVYVAYCDIIEITVRILNDGSAEAFNGTIAIHKQDYDVISWGDLPSPTNADNSTYYIRTFTTPSISNSQSVTYTYYVRGKSGTGLSEYIITNSYKRPSTNEINYSEVNIDFQSRRDISLWGFDRVSELLDDFDNNSGHFTILPLEEVSGHKAACDEESEQRLYISDEFIVDIEEYCILDGSIIIEPGGKIIVESGSTLNLSNLRIYSCNKMWRGIYVESGGILNIENCDIENAQFGISAERGSTVTAYNNFFIDNYIGFFVSPFTYPNDMGQASASYLTANLYKNQFFGTGSLLDPYTSQTPSPTEKPYAGIMVSNLSSFILSGDIVPGAITANSFVNMTNGVIVNNSAFTMGDAFFEDITNDLNLTSSIEGNGVYLNNCRTISANGNTIGSGNGFSSHFDNCDVAFNVFKGGSVKVYGFTMGNVIKGISLNSVRNAPVAIEENTISAELKGIELLFCAPRGGDIRTNYVNVLGDGDATIGIEMADLMAAPSRWVIEDNEIIFGDAIFGILNTGGRYVTIKNNSITREYYNEDDGANILLQGTKNSLVSCNYLEGDMDAENNNFRLTSGLILDGANNFDVRCNETYNCRYGIRIASDNTGENILRGNIFNEAYDALYYGNSAVTGNQYHQGNQWCLPKYSDFAAKHEGPVDIVGYSKFEHTSASCLPPPSVSSFSTSWFRQTSGTTLVCDDEEDCPFGIGFYSLAATWDSLDLALANGNLGFENFNNALSWKARFHMFRKLGGSPGTTGWPSSLITFIGSQGSTNIGKFSNALDSISKSIVYVGPLEDELDEYSDLIHYYLDSLRHYSFELYLDRDGSAILDRMKEIQDSIFFAECLFLPIDSTVQDKLDSTTVNAIDYIVGISTDSIWHDYLQFIMLETLDFTQNDNLQSSTDIYNLAQTCPDQFGDAVYFARSLIRFDSTLVKYDNQSLCTPLHPRSYERIKTVLGYPNPTTDLFNVESSSPISQVQIVNSQGAIVSNLSGNFSSRMSIKTNSLLPGLYLLRVMTEPKSIEVLKFVKLND